MTLPFFVPELSVLLAFTLAGLVLFATPGPDMSLWLARTMQGGRRLPWEDADDPARDANLRRLGFMRDGILGMLARDPRERASLADVLRSWRSTLQRDNTTTVADVNTATDSRQA